MIIQTVHSGLFGVALTIAALFLLAALVLAAWRLLTGPTLADRVVALDLVSTLLVVFLVIFKMVSGVDAYIYAGIGLALISFLATVAFANFMDRASGISMTDWLAAALILAGTFFCLVAGIGIVRMHDVFGRLHAATKAGTFGLALICLAAMIEAQSWQQVVEAVLVFLFMIASAPIGAHLIGRAAFRARAPVDPKTRIDPGCNAFRRWQV